MKRIVVVAALASLMVVPNASTGASSTARDARRAVNDCESVRPSMNRTVGAGTFARAFGAHRFRTCERAFTVEEHANRHAVLAVCSELTGRAYGECVAGEKRDASREDRRDWVNAAKVCKEEHSPGGQARSDYGKCVADVAKAQNDEEPAL